MAEKFELGLPDKFDLFDRGSHIEIVRKWFGWPILVQAVFAILWNWLTFNDYSKGNQSEDLFLLLSVAVGIGLTYATVAGWFNRTSIYVGLGKITVRHGPIPWFGNKELEASNIKQLHAEEKRGWSGQGGTYVSYEVHAITNDERRTKLVSGLETKEQAMNIERKIEKYLGIEDVRVEGEI